MNETLWEERQKGKGAMKCKPWMEGTPAPER